MIQSSTNVTDGRTDGRTDERHAISRPRLHNSASRGVKTCTYTQGLWEICNWRIYN